MDERPSALSAETWSAFARALDVPMLVLEPRRDDAGHLLDMIVVDANPAALARVHRTHDEMIGRSLADALLIPSDDRLQEFVASVDEGAVIRRASYRVDDIEGAPREFDTLRVSFDGLVGLAWIDITEVETARKVSAESQTRYRLLAERSSELVFELDLDEQCMWISPSVEGILGWAPADLIGTRVLDLIHTEDRAAVETRRRSVFVESADSQVEARVQAKDGSFRWMLGRARPHRDDTGQVVGGYVHLTDVDERHRATDALRRSEAHFRLLAEHASDVVYQIDADAVIEWISPSVERKLGYSPAELVGRPSIEIIATDDRPLALAAREQRIAGIPPDTIEARYLTRDGETRWMSVQAQVVTDADGATNAVVISLREIDAERRARDAQAHSEASFRMLAEHSSDIVFRLGADGRCAWISPSVEWILGWKPEDLVGTEMLQLAHPDDLHTLLDQRRQMIAGGEPFELEARTLTRDDNWRWVLGRGRAERDATGAVIGAVVNFTDVDDLHRARDELAASEARFRAVAENVSDVVIEFDREQVCQWISPSVEWILGWHPADLRGSTLLPLAHPAEQAELLEKWMRLLETGTPQELQVRVRASDGTYRWMVGRSRPRFDDAGAVIGAFSSFTDIDEAVRSGEAFAHAAHHDSLTGLANRADLLDEIDRALAGDRRAGVATAVLVIDLDHFKDVNDSLGHPVGDRLLSSAAQRLRECVRAGEYLARMGGDEFTVVIRGVSEPSSATQVAQRIVDAFRTPFVLADSELFTTASVGVVIADPADTAVTPDTLLRDGDSALYYAKEHGRDRWSMFNNELREALEERLRLERELRGALERDEFELYYQPEVDLRTGELTGVEALLRWHHPSGELYPAGRFIEVAEGTGLILQVGAWALRAACRQAAEWATRFPDHPLVVRFNISTLQLSETRLLSELDAVLRETAMPPGRLCVEITETALLRSTHVVAENLEGLRRRGLSLAFDEFGAGSSSLASLRDFPVDRLTLDRGFVADITTDELDRNIVAGVLALAQRLSLPVTAGGIEHAEQAEMLAAFGCQRAQGFLYAPALPAAQIDKLLSGR